MCLFWLACDVIMRVRVRSCDASSDGDLFEWCLFRVEPVAEEVSGHISTVVILHLILSSCNAKSLMQLSVTGFSSSVDVPYSRLALAVPPSNQSSLLESRRSTFDCT